MLSDRSPLLRGPRVRPADGVRIVAPSGPVGRDRFDAGVFALGGRYRLQYDPSTLYARTGFLAGEDEARLASLNAAIADPDCRAIFMARGGYGLLRLLPFIDFAGLRQNPRPIVGFSDGTALLAACAAAGVAAIHGPVVTQMGRLPDADRAALVRLLEDPQPGLLMSDLEDLMPGRVQGPLLGGNLEVFSRLLGTPFLPDLDGAVLLIEDVGERPYRVDRLLTHLDLAGVFSRVAAVVVGDFVDCDEPENGIAGSPTVRDVLIDRLSRLPIPVVLGAPVGHGARNVALPYGTLVELDTRYGTLQALEGVVS